jgi:GTP cyclohydrolase I
MDSKIKTINWADLIEGSDLTVGKSKNGHNKEIVNLTHDLLLAVGEDPNREGLQRTPERVARMYNELLAGYTTDPVALINGAVFESDYKSMVLVRDIEFHSMCEHHMLPFNGKAHVAYIPDGKIIGLSKIPRLVEMYARRLQVQERLTQQVAEALDTILHPRGVAVVVEGVHMCSVMRGVKKTGTSMVTSDFVGEFETNEKLRKEFLTHIQRGESLH